MGAETDEEILIQALWRLKDYLFNIRDYCLVGLSEQQL